MRAVDALYLMERLQKLCDAQECPCTRSLDICGIRIWDYIRLNSTRASWREEIYPCFQSLQLHREGQETDNYSKQFYKLHALACLSSAFIHLFLGCNPWDSPALTHSDCKSDSSNWIWDYGKFGNEHKFVPNKEYLKHFGVSKTQTLLKIALYSLNSYYIYTRTLCIHSTSINFYSLGLLFNFNSVLNWRT